MNDGGADGEGPDEPEEIARQLDESYASWVNNLTDEQTDAIRAWQEAHGRHYETIQNAFRTGDQLDTGVLDEIESLETAIASGQLPMPLVAWKGIRSMRRAFGVEPDGLDALRGTSHGWDGSFAATLDRDVAVEEFTEPPGPPNAALMRMRLARAPALHG